ncbi:MAG TPA: RNA chaperone Hfq [Thermotogota bacterium]|nr:RNA chaperone Hfq [Thermotogota bacterium]NLZ14496.1 RNA chaperone Hfq [Thermotogaceae bacterium]MDD8052683.1 RNA chaperone Hfq [Thermotogota bacterium]HNR62585.1 RNA chaperone Hfq [Thermotogota bacterium]HNT94591.1 RNA chaperone Hfq [Thermotogota bacterium]
MAEKFNLQDRFLNHLRLHKVEAKVFLVNGFQIRGEIRSFDSFTILLEDGKTQSLIYKHAISTITPSSYVKLAKPQEDDASSDEESNKTVNVSK